jgi:hypothetical protein
VTWYCDKTCRTADFSEHKRACKAIKQRRYLLRAASTLRKVWTAIRESAWNQDVCRLEFADGMLCLHEGDQTAFKRGHVYSAFPQDLTENEVHKEAILTKNRGPDVPSLLYNLASKLLEGESLHVNTNVVSLTLRRPCH